MKMIRSIATVLVLTVLAAGCESGTEPADDGLSLRISNGTDAAIVVVVEANIAAVDFEGPTTNANFGSVAPGGTSEFRQVANRFKVRINGVPLEEFQDNPNWGELGISDAPSRRWTLTIFPQSWDLSAYFEAR